MPTMGAMLGMKAAGNAIDAGMGLLMEGHNDRRQLRQQQKLTDQQVQAQMALTNHNMTKQLEMWEKTGYGAQMEQMKKAGLNPGLIYGMGGAGGQTANINTGSVQGSHAPAGGGEIMGLMQGQNLAMQMAQIENVKADTEKKKVEAEKTAGVDTQLAGSQISKIIAETTNEGVKTGLTQVETKLKELELFIGHETAKDNIDRIGWMTDRALEELSKTQRENYIGRATQNAVIDTIRTESVAAVLRNVLTRAQTANTKQDTALKGQQMEGIKSNILLNDAMMSNMIQKLEIDWERLSQGQKELRIREQLKDFNTDLNNDVVRELAGGLTDILGRFPKNKTTTRETFKDGEGNSYETRQERY